MSVSAVHGGSQAEKQTGPAPQPVSPPSGGTSFAQELDTQRAAASHHHRHHAGASQSVTSSAASAASAAGSAPTGTVGSALLHLLS